MWSLIGSVPLHTPQAWIRDVLGADLAHSALDLSSNDRGENRVTGRNARAFGSCFLVLRFDYCRADRVKWQLPWQVMCSVREHVVLFLSFQVDRSTVTGVGYNGG
jgi:hypothetical protein